VIFSSDFQ